MNSRTKKNLLLNIAIVLVSLCACGFLAYKISSQGEQLKGFIQVLNEQNTQEDSFIRINRLVLDTEEERATITKLFFQDESDSIAFLGDIESFAKKINLELETTGLNKVIDEKTKAEHITMTFKYTGMETTVREFTQLLENVPYHAWVKSLSLRRVNNGLWEGEATLIISIQTP